MKNGPRGRFKYMKPIPDERDVKDLYYLDEMIKDIYEERGTLQGGWKWIMFLRDWYAGLKDKVGHTDKERKAHLIKNFGKEMLDQFLTEKERDLFLNNDL